MRKMEDLPLPTQQELVAARRSVEGWEPMCKATPDQWMEFYDKLSPRGRYFVVEGLLEQADRGAACVQADHESMYEGFMGQLRAVTQLHNARVDECAQLRQQVEGLMRIARGEVGQERMEEILEEMKEDRSASAADLTVLPVNLGDESGAGAQFFVQTGDCRSE